jgi:hypothetical protein
VLLRDQPLSVDLAVAIGDTHGQAKLRTVFGRNNQRLDAVRIGQLAVRLNGEVLDFKLTFSPSVQVPSDSNPMEVLGLPSQEAGGIGDELTASEEALRFGWASWAIHDLFKKLTDCGDAS